ncbi:MAG: endonuclease/exonuclease/phosphatase family protein [Acidimicrobiia bacterium]
MTLNVLYGASGRERLVRDVVSTIGPAIAVFTEAQSTDAFEVVVNAVGRHHAWSGSRGDRERVVIASRWPILSSETFGPAWSPSKWVLATIQPPCGAPLVVVGVSLCPDVLWISELGRLVEISVLLRRVSTLRQPHVIAGDFNALAPGDRHSLRHAPWWVRAQRMSQGYFTPRWAITRLSAAGYQDCFRTLNPAANGFTMPSWDPQARIDYIFASSDMRGALRSSMTQPFAGVGFEVRRTLSELLGTTSTPDLGGAASDHLAVWSGFD